MRKVFMALGFLGLAAVGLAACVGVELSARVPITQPEWKRNTQLAMVYGLAVPGGCLYTTGRGATFAPFPCPANKN